MNHRSLLSSFILAAIASGLSGCGNGDPKVPPTSEASVGQQLSDLEDARQKGIISNREYSRLKKALIKRHD